MTKKQIDELFESRKCNLYSRMEVYDNEVPDDILSNYGINCFPIDNEIIEALKNGKMLVLYDGEYSTIIMVKN